MKKSIPSCLSLHLIINKCSAPVIRSARRMVSVLILLAGLLAVLTPTDSVRAETVREGDPAPKIQLRSEDNRPIQLNAEGRNTIMTFIFTRCAAMEFCPRMNSKFDKLQSAIQEEDLTKKLRLLSITLDPEFDRPERLKDFGKAIKADPAIWNFATGSKAQIDTLTSDFRVFRENQEGILTHTLCTALVRPDGTVEKIWRGNYWKPEDILEHIRSL